ncbi:MAG: monofunctional biosynthetic peptidoglycan transglycosylase [Agitococcus sp.]|jgi:monofunctional biosynthetic peptidoglycan transglycosylase|nr:monofunctional biosynthetic peptidoglycan transglycosylase [Agitococcus sp.]MDO9178733.1 monofunctional biosynthetic peptidoglycan transglycosylase [Agitococcus sp.]
MTLRVLVWRGILFVIGLFVAYQLWLFAHVFWWINHNPETSAFMETQLQVLQSKNPDAELKHRWVAYNQISPNLKKALITSEDAKFLDHEGFDWEGIQTAWEKNLKKGKIVAGGSTISQQLAKNLFLSGKKTPWRKLEEAAITVMMEQMMSKRRIFEIYLNVIEWGNGVFGAEAASRHYYRKSARSLSASESAKLAAMVPNPRYYDKHRSDRRLLRKTRIIQRRMYYADYP